MLPWINHQTYMEVFTNHMPAHKSNKIAWHQARPGLSMGLKWPGGPCDVTTGVG